MLDTEVRSLERSGDWLALRHARCASLAELERCHGEAIACDAEETEAANYRRAYVLARGSYQKAIVRGEAAISGSDLRGKAAKYGSSYARSRLSLCIKLGDARLAWVKRGERGKLTLEFGPLPAGETRPGRAQYLSLPLVTVRE